ncbi:MAG: hypothetical protein IKD69_10310, partial [Solobacterium sp.]|nr:hypothetical protein [Solobacterium sp.]
LMHQVGPYDEKVGEMVREFETKIEALAERLGSDTGLLVIADHSQVPVETVDLSMEKDLADCLYRRPSLEGRAMTFFVKEDCRQTFARLFTERYGDRFNLMSHAKVMETELFGTGKPHERFEKFIGDYLAVAIANTQFVFGKKKVTMGNHAGGTEEEAMVPLILYPYL